MAYLPIERHGIIGNMRTAALVGTNGTIDWYCYPSFDAPSVFGSLLDDEKGGSFEIAPASGDAHARSSSTGRTPTSSSRASSPPTASARSPTS